MNAAIGRWLTRDPAGFIDSLNEYAYVADRAMSATDPSGMTLTFQDCTKDQRTTITTAFDKIGAEYADCLKNSGLEDCFETLCAADTLFICKDCSDDEEAENLCANTTVGTSSGPCKPGRKPDTTLKKKYLISICVPIEETRCGPLATTIMHEMIHNCGVTHGDDVNEGALDGCPKKCFDAGPGDADKCKCC